MNDANIKNQQNDTSKNVNIEKLGDILKPQVEKCSVEGIKVSQDSEKKK